MRRNFVRRAALFVALAVWAVALGFTLGPSGAATTNSSHASGSALTPGIRTIEPAAMRATNNGSADAISAAHGGRHRWSLAPGVVVCLLLLALGLAGWAFRDRRTVIRLTAAQWHRPQRGPPSLLLARL